LLITSSVAEAANKRGMNQSERHEIAFLHLSGCQSAMDASLEGLSYYRRQEYRSDSRGQKTHENSIQDIDNAVSGYWTREELF